MVSLFALISCLSLALLVFGLINPRWVIFRGSKTKSKAALIYGMSAAISLVLFGCNFPGSTQSTNDTHTTQPQVAETSKAESGTPTNSPTITIESPQSAQPVVQGLGRKEVVQKSHSTVVTRSPEVKPVHPKSQKLVQETESQKFTPKPSPKIVARLPEQPKEETASDVPSRSPKKGSCECPYDRDSADRICGKRSAFSRPNGEHPVCYRR